MRDLEGQTLGVKSDDVKAQVFLRNFGTLTACSVKYTNDMQVTDYSKVEFSPLSYFLSEMDGQVYGVRVYTASGYLLATIPVICRISHYASAYIDSMAQYNGTVKIDKDNIIYSPRILAGKYEGANVGQKVFTGVALGDYGGKDTEPSMRLAGIYGFNKGTQVYAFKEDGTAFIGSGNGRINFDGTNATLYNSNYESNRGMLIDLDGSDIFCKNSNHQAYFGAGNEKNPLRIGSNFSVDWGGNVNIGGNGSININNGTNGGFKADSNGINMTGIISLSDRENNKVNIDSKGISLSSGEQASVIISSSGIQLNGSITGIDYNNLINKPTIPDADSLKMSDEQIAQAVSNKSPGLYYEKGKLGINANGITAGSLNADRIGAGILNVTVGIKRGFSLYGDSSAGFSDNPAAWEEFGELVPTTGMVGTRITHGVRLAVKQKNLQGDNTGQKNMLFISDAGIRMEFGGGSDHGGVTFGFYNDGLHISGEVTDEEGNTEIKSKTYSWV